MLELLIDEYEADGAIRLRNELEYYRSIKSFADVIVLATQGLGPERSMHKHQCRLGYDLLRQQAAVLVESATLLRQSRSFKELYASIESLRLYGVGPLACYDTAIRLGSWLGLMPTEIYLHCGARQGYRALGLMPRGRIAEIGSLPLVLQRLTAVDLEDFLCIYKDRLAGRSGSTSCKNKQRFPAARRRCSNAIHETSSQYR